MTVFRQDAPVRLPQTHLTSEEEDASVLSERTHSLPVAMSSVDIEMGVIQAR